MKERAEALLPLFNEEFPDEKTTLQRIFTTVHKHGKQCKCGAKLAPNFESRSFECRSCGRVDWLTSDTGFRNVRQLRTHVAAAWFQDKGIILSGPLLASLTGTPVSTCQDALKNPALTIIQAALQAPHQVLVPTAEFCSTYKRRSTETPAREHPVAEQEAMEKECGKPSQSGQQISPASSSQPGLEPPPEANTEPGPETSFGNLETPALDQGSDDSKKPLGTAGLQIEPPARSAEEGALVNCTDTGDNAPDDKSSDESNQKSIDESEPCELSLDQQILTLLANSESPLHFDEILDNLLDGALATVGVLTSELMNLWLAGRLKLLFGDYWTLPPVKETRDQLKCSNFIRGVLDEFCYQVQLFQGGISRKHVQLHLALFCFHKVRACKELAEDWLFKAMCKRKPSSIKAIPDVSPLLVNMFGFLNLDQPSLTTEWLETAG